MSLYVTISLRDAIEIGNFDEITMEVTDDLEGAVDKFAHISSNIELESCHDFVLYSSGSLACAQGCPRQMSHFEMYSLISVNMRGQKRL